MLLKAAGIPLPSRFFGLLQALTRMTVKIILTIIIARLMPIVNRFEPDLYLFSQGPKIEVKFTIFVQVPRIKAGIEMC